MLKKPLEYIWPDDDLEKDLINYFFYKNILKEKNKNDSINTFNILQNEEICEEILQKLLIWIIETSDLLNCSFKVKQRSMILINIFISKEKIDAIDLQLLGITSLFISTKLEDKKGLTLENLIYLTANQYTQKDILDMEMRILKTLQWRLNFAIPGEISRFLLNECVLNLNESIFEQIDEFINYTLTIWELAQFDYKIIAVSCVLYFLFSTKNEEVLNFLTKFILQNNAVDLKVLEEFNSNFYTLISDDENLLILTKNYFKSFNKFNVNKMTTPSQKKDIFEEEKSTLDTIAQNKYDKFNFESPSLNTQAEFVNNVIINPFSKFVEEPKSDKIQEEHNINIKEKKQFEEVIYNMLLQNNK